MLRSLRPTRTLLSAVLVAALLATLATGCRRRRATPPPVAASGYAPSARITDFEAQTNALARCATGAALPARLSLRFVVTGDGGVADATIIDPPGVAPDASVCIARTAAAFGFPSYVNGIATMEYTLAAPALPTPRPETAPETASAVGEPPAPGTPAEADPTAEEGAVP
jgi:hypothetical protein